MPVPQFVMMLVGVILAAGATIALAAASGLSMMALLPVTLAAALAVRLINR